MDEEERKWKEKLIALSRGGRPPPVPPPLGFEVPDDLSNLKSALEEHEDSQPKPLRTIVDDQLFDLKFNLDMSQSAKEAVILQRYAIATSNHKMVEQMLAEAEAEVKQALWKLTAIQPQLYDAHENILRFFNSLYELTDGRCSKFVRKAISDCESNSKKAWECDWEEEWVYGEENVKEEDRMKEIAQARTAGVPIPPSPSPPAPHR